MRTLASRTQDSTQEIQNTIERLQKGSEQAVNVMNSSKLVGEKTVDNSVSAGASLDEIANEVEIITGMNSKIATASIEQIKMVDSIKNSIYAMQNEVNSSADASSSNKELSFVLSENANTLNTLIAQFKV